MYKDNLFTEENDLKPRYDNSMHKLSRRIVIVVTESILLTISILHLIL